MDVLILTPIKKEYKAVRKYLTNLKSITKDNCNYEVGEFVGQYQTFKIAIRQTGSRNVPVAIALNNGYQHFFPKIALLVGVAGGIKDVIVGDVVIANKAYGYASGKEKDGQYFARPVVFPFSIELLTLAERIEQAEAWKYRIGIETANPTVYFAPIASDDKLIASRNSMAYKIIKKHFNDAAALEMEATGFGEAAFQHPLLRTLNIRGISDLLDDKLQSDASGNQELAAETAAAFTFELLNQLNLQTLNFSNMTIEQTVAETTNLIQPQLEIILGEAENVPSNLYQQLIWEKIKPIIDGELNELKMNAKNRTILSEIPVVLKSYLRKNEKLQKELIALIEQTKKTESIDSSILEGNKNAFYKPTIEFRRDGHIGDNITNYHGNIDKQWNIEENHGDFNFGKE